MKTAKSQPTHRTIRNIYLYAVALIGLIIFAIGSIGIINIVFKNYVFKIEEYIYEPVSRGMKSNCAMLYPDPADIQGKHLIAPSEEEIRLCEEKTKAQQKTQQKNQLARDFSIAIAQIFIGFALWLVHWRIIQKEWRL